MMGWQFPKDIAAMEQNLKRLEEQEQKYSAELDAALNEYAGLREQAQGFDPVQLHEARHAIRPGKEQWKRRTGYSRFTARSTARF